MNKVQKIREEVVRMHNLLPIIDGDNISVNYADRICTTLEMYIDSLQEEPVSEDLEEAAHEYADLRMSNYETAFYAFMSGAKWQKENLWKSADGEDLPEIDREVIVLVDNFGKLIPKLAKRTYHLIENFVDEDTGEIISIENTDEVGDIINWTEPAIYWLDVDLPKLEED